MTSPSLHSHLIHAKVADDRRARERPGTARIGGGATDRGATRTPGPNRAQGRSAGRFLRHYAEMVVSMFLGMFVLMTPTGWLLSAFGTSWSGLSPAMNTFAMALTMTVPMVGWMRYRGHTWKPCAEMAASMLIPTFGVMAVLWAGAGTSGALTVPEHAAMLVCMLLAMLLRSDEYAAAGHAHRPRWGHVAA
jgi:hypothetical protein